MRNSAGPGRTRRVLGYGAVAALLALAGAGCADSDSDSDEGSDKNPGKSSTESPTESPTEGSDKSPDKSSTPTPTASDGTDIAACADGNCEISATKPVTVPLKVFQGPASIELTKVGKDGIGYQVTLGTKDNGTRTSSEIKGANTACTATIHQGGSSGSCGPAGEAPPGEKGAVVMHLATGADGTAILRLVHEK